MKNAEMIVGGFYLLCFIFVLTFATFVAGVLSRSLGKPLNIDKPMNILGMTALTLGLLITSVIVNSLG